MRGIPSVLWGVVLLGGVAAANLAALAGDAKAEREKLAGVWHVTRLVANGKEAPPAAIAKMKLTVSGEKIVVLEPDGKEESGTYTLDPGKSPRHINLTATDGPDKGKTILGIYKLEGADELTLCFSPPAAEQRPQDFVSDEKTSTLLVVLKRDKK